MTQVGKSIVPTSQHGNENIAAPNASVVEIDVIMLDISEKHLVRLVDNQHTA
jgi:hypothetical protein